MTLHVQSGLFQPQRNSLPGIGWCRLDHNRTREEAVDLLGNETIWKRRMCFSMQAAALRVCDVMQASYRSFVSGNNHT